MIWQWCSGGVFLLTEEVYKDSGETEKHILIDTHTNNENSDYFKSLTQIMQAVDLEVGILASSLIRVFQVQLSNCSVPYKIQWLWKCGTHSSVYTDMLMWNQASPLGDVEPYYQKLFEGLVKKGVKNLTGQRKKAESAQHGYPSCVALNNAANPFSLQCCRSSLPQNPLQEHSQSL